MKLSALLSLVLTFFISLGLASCDDDLNNIGGSLQPPGDNIVAGTDTLPVIARTISMQDAVYAQTLNGVLGKYEDDIFGSIKSDYLCQFYYTSDYKLKDKIAYIDSVQFRIAYLNYLGDTVSPMGLSVYKVTKALPEYFYTNADPKEYTDMKTLIANKTFSVAGNVVKGSSYKEIIAEMDTTFAVNLFKAINTGVVKDKETFNKYFPGVYVTTTFGSGTLIQPMQTSINIKYKYYTAKADSLGSAWLSMNATTEVNQLIHIENKNPDQLFDANSGMVYAKTPAGVYPEVVFPIKKIKENMIKNNYESVNTALFTLTGYTEKEPTGTFSYGKTSRLLLINKDSVDYFFSHKELQNNKTTFIAERSEASNTYKFSNLSRLITIYKDKNLTEDPTFVLVPVDLLYADYYNTELVRVYNKMLPTASIFRNNFNNNQNNMRLTLIYTKFK